MPHPPHVNSFRTHKGRARVPIFVLGMIIALFAAWTTSSTHTVAQPGRQPTPTPTPALVREQADLLDPEAEGGEKEHEHLTNPDKGAGKSRVQIQADERSEETGVTITGSLAPNVGGTSMYMPELPDGFYPIHATNMQKGTLLIAGSGNSESNHDMHMYLSYYCDFDLQNCEKIPTNTDLFCGDNVQLQDGSVVMLGGTTSWGSKGWKGDRRVYRFDENYPERGWQFIGNMVNGRWYPRGLLQTNGLVLTASGVSEIGKLVTRSELFNTSTHKTKATKGTRSWPLYPSIWRTSKTGQMVYLGAGTSRAKASIKPGFWVPATNKFTPFAGLRKPNQRNSAAVCAIGNYSRQQFIVAGGSGTGGAIREIDKIDLKAKKPKFTAAGYLPDARKYMSCVRLPNGSVVLIGGGSGNKIERASLKVTLIKSYGAAPIALNDLPAGEYFLYHSNAILGRGKTCGGGILLFGSNPDAQARNTHIICYKLPMQMGATPDTPNVPAKIKRYTKAVPVEVSPDTTKLHVRSRDSVTHGLNNAGLGIDIAVKNGVADFSPVWLRYLPENSLDVYAVNGKTGAYSPVPASFVFS